MTFSGLPINGNIIFGTEPKDQKPDTEFEATLQAVLDDPTIAYVTWRQYTPYFNDGDPCVFHAYMGGVGIKGQYDPMNDEEGDLHDDMYDFPPYSDLGRAVIGRRDWAWENGERVDKGYTGPDVARYDRLSALAEVLSGGHHDALLLKKFGDHAQIIVTPKEGIEVEFYEHD